MYRTAIGMLAVVAGASAAGLLSGPAHSQTGEQTGVKPVSGCDMSKEHGVPTTASEMLQRLANALRDGSFLEPESYEQAALACVFGSYTFRSLSKPTQDLELVFQDEPAGLPTRARYTGLGAGYLFLRRPQPDSPSFAMTVSVRAVDDRFAIERVVQIFGSPSEVTDWAPSGPGLHGHVEPPRKRDGLKNARVSFEFKSADYWSRITFPTSEDGIVTGFQANGGRSHQ